jgi:hypothetical protein
MYIEVDKIYYKYNRMPDKYAGLSSSAKRKAQKLEKQLKKVEFDLRPYGMDVLDFSEMFEMTIKYDPSQKFVKEDEFHSHYIGFKLIPHGPHKLAEFCGRLLANGDEGYLQNRIYSWQLACDNMFESILDCMNSFLRFLINDLYPKRYDIATIPDNLGVCGLWCGQTKSYELYVHVRPHDVKALMTVSKDMARNHDAQHQDGAMDALPEYEKYVIDELAAILVKQNGGFASVYNPEVNVVPFLPWFRQYRKVKLYENAKTDCADVIEKVDARAEEIREMGKVTLGEAAAAKEEKHE